MKREEIDPEILLMDGFDSCFVGIVERADSPDIACYDYEKCIEKIMQDTRMDETDSREYFQFNCACAWVGDRTPCFINPALLEE